MDRLWVVVEPPEILSRTLSRAARLPPGGPNLKGTKFEYQTSGDRSAGQKRCSWALENIGDGPFAHFGQDMAYASGDAFGAGRSKARTAGIEGGGSNWRSDLRCGLLTIEDSYSGFDPPRRGRSFDRGFGTGHLLSSKDVRFEPRSGHRSAPRRCRLMTQSGHPCT